MNKYLSKIRKLVLDYQKDVEEKAEAKKQLKLKYSKGDIAKNNYEKLMEEVELENKANADVVSSIDRVIGEYQEELKQWAVLKSEDLTEDLKLFNTPIQISPEDYTALEEKNQHNYSMLKAIKAHAAEKDVLYTQKYSINKEEKLSELNEFRKVAINIFKTVQVNGSANYMGELWKREDKFNDMYDDVSRIIQTA